MHFYVTVHNVLDYVYLFISIQKLTEIQSVHIALHFMLFWAFLKTQKMTDEITVIKLLSFSKFPMLGFVKVMVKTIHVMLC